MSDESARPIHICVVCSGNICRSPYAEVLLRRAADERGWGTQVKVTSAGTLGISDSPAHDISLAVAAEKGMNLMMFRSTPLTDELLHQVDLFVLLGREHRGWFESRTIPESARVWLITQPGQEPPTDDDPGILDPIGFEESDYRTALETIDVALPALVEGIENAFSLTGEEA